MVNPHRCLECGKFFESPENPRRPRKFCSSACRQKHYRRNRSQIPAILRNLNRWSRCVGKRPVMPDGSPASSTDPSTWSPYRDVMSGAGDGFGIMLGDGLACWDFDHCLDDDGEMLPDSPACRLIGRIDYPIFTEVSCSGHGLHVFVKSFAASSKRPGVEFYSHSRFIRMTGRRWPYGD